MPAVADDLCSSYVGKAITPLSFDDATKDFQNLTPKDEFETSDAYKARVTEALAGIPKGLLLIEKKPEDRKFFEYNADSQELSIVSFAFHNTGFDAWGAFYGTVYNDRLKADTSNNAVVVVERTEIPDGSYEAENGFGVKIQVTKLKLLTYVIYEGPRKVGDYNFFKKETEKGSYVGKLKLPPAEAKKLKSEARLAFVVLPRDPYIVVGQYLVGEPTIKNPVERIDTYKALIADIQCGLLMDKSGKVLGAYAAK